MSSRLLCAVPALRYPGLSGGCVTRSISLLGATGSIGASTLDLIRHKMLANLHRESYVAMVEILGLDPATGKKKVEE